MYCIYSSINSGAIWGIEPYIVNIEADISQGMPYFNMVGLLSSEVKEARERVRTAIRNSGESLPMYRITINLSPADRKKEGSGFDFPIAVALLCAMGRIKADDIKDTFIIGELGLDGELKKVNGVLPMVNMAKKKGLKACFIPKANANEVKRITDIKVYAFDNLSQVIIHLNSKDKTKNLILSENSISDIEIRRCGDFNEIFGQEAVKRAIIVAASGWHNIMMIGQPGVGKSMLASRIPGIMNEMTEEEINEVLNIQSICGTFIEGEKFGKRPYSAPHHSITTAALVGGGKIPKPGEITIAHKGVLFLDELPEFSPQVLDSLRQPLEEKRVKIHRLSGNYEFPAECLFVAAMNPCKCGYYPDKSRCRCSENDVANYLGRVSGPIIDRMDMSIEVPRVGVEYIDSSETCMSSKQMREIVVKAVNLQKERQGEKYNSQLSVEEIRKFCRLGKKETKFIKEAYSKLQLSMRGYYKIIKVARTIADVEASEEISIDHIAEAIGYRMADINLYTGER